MELTKVDFPGYVKNREKAIQILGGPGAIFNSIMSKDAPLKISFRPNDQLGHDVQSSTQELPCVLIKVKVIKKYIIQNGRKKLIKTELAPEFVGKAMRTFTFDQPSDFQFLPPLSSPYNSLTTKDPPLQNFLYLPPIHFLHNYKYDNSYIQRRIFGAQQEQMKTWTKADCPWVINQDLLLTLDHGPSVPEPADDINPSLLNMLTDMFNFRPIWTALAIFDHFSNQPAFKDLHLNETSTVFYHTLSCVAYYIKNGPYKMCWVKYGANPVFNQHYAKFQTIVLSLKTWEYADEISKRIKRKYIPKIDAVPQGISSLSALPNRLFYAIQLCDLNDTFPKDLLSTVQTKFSTRSGWFPPETIVSIRKFCLLKLLRMLKDESSSIHPDIIMADVSSMSDLKKGIEMAHPVQKRPEYDFNFLNDFQTALGIYDSSDATKKDDFNSIFGKRFSTLSVCGRIHTY